MKNVNMDRRNARMPAMKCLRFLAIFLMGLGTAGLASPNAALAEPALPGEPCEIEPPRDSQTGEHKWTPQERWAWSEICEGREANFNYRYDPPDPLDPKEADGWNDDRKLRSSFLETILLHEPFRGALTRKGVRIIGAWFPKPIDLENATLGHELWLHRSRFDSSANLRSLKTENLISLIGSKFAGTLNMNSLEVGGSLLMRGDAEFGEVDLVGAKIGGVISMIGSKFAGELDMNSLEVGGSLFMRGDAEFADVDLVGAKIGGQLSMIGSKFAGTLVMDSLEVGGSLLMSGGAEFGEVDLRGAKIGGQIDMSGSKFMRKLNMDSLEVGSSLFMRNGAFGQLIPQKRRIGKVILVGAKIGGQLSMIGSKFTGRLNMDSLEVGSSLLMRGGAEFGEVDLRSAKIGGQIDMTGSKFAGELVMDKVDVGSSLFMRGGAEFGKVDLRSAKIGGQLSMIGSKFKGELDMDSLEVGSDLFMHDGQFDGPVSLIFATIDSSLNLSGATVTSLDITATRVNGELSLGSDKPSAVAWQENSRLTLRNTVVGTLQSPEEPWPKDLDLELDGFTYSRLGGFGAEAGPDMASRDAQRFIDWLAKDETFSPQPYQQLASVLRAAGHNEKANDILYAGKERERTELLQARAWPSWLWSTLKWAFLGHGYRIYSAVYWMIGFIFLGALVLRVSEQGIKNKMPWGFAYSLDLLTPILRLREYHYEQVKLVGWPRYYFYAHQLMGYVLLSFLIAGLAGLVK